MKQIIALILVVIFSTTAFAGDTCPDTQGDGWPWPWGTECPFPWSDVEGEWVVKSVKRPKKFDNSFLNLHVEDKSKSGDRLLFVEQYDKEGKLEAVGTGIFKKKGRVLNTIMDPVKRNKRSYRVIIRSYLKDFEKAALEPKQCQSKESMMAVTFCSLYGKKCLENSNYMLERPSEASE